MRLQEYVDEEFKLKEAPENVLRTKNKNLRPYVSIKNIIIGHHGN